MAETGRLVFVEQNGQGEAPPSSWEKNDREAREQGAEKNTAHTDC
ncbi:hypothetical protein [Paenibacillus lutimineralis]|nr:hypothetical protein [Paenibacillus lutimineralis]